MLPGNVLLRFTGPHRQLGGSVVFFGVLVCCLAAARGYQAVLALRIFIGCGQALIQGLGLYVSLWYRRDELATRSGIVANPPFPAELG